MLLLRWWVLACQEAKELGRKLEEAIVLEFLFSSQLERDAISVLRRHLY